MDQSRMKAQNLRDKLSQWESYLAPLSDQQKDSYLQLSAAATTRPLPPQVRWQDTELGLKGIPYWYSLLLWYCASHKKWSHDNFLIAYLTSALSPSLPKEASVRVSFTLQNVINSPEPAHSYSAHVLGLQVCVAPETSTGVGEQEQLDFSPSSDQALNSQQVSAKANHQGIYVSDIT